MFNDIIKAINIEPYYRDNHVAIFNGDCKEILPLLSNIDAIVTDPPYGLVSINKRFGNGNAHNTPAMETKEGSVWARKAKGFMGKEWDGSGIEYDVEMWQGCINALKNGGHLLAFGGTRTYHRMACAIEDAGFEIRDMIEWVYGSGFPKSLNIGKAIDKIQGNEREDLGYVEPFGRENRKARQGKGTGTVPFGKEEGIESKNHLTKGTSEWEGWGTALKPAHEPICMARKPIKGTVAENVLEYGTGGINIDGCRVGTEDNLNGGAYSKGDYDTQGKVLELGLKRQEGKYQQPLGRFPANLIHDNSEEVRECFPNAGRGNGKGAYNYAGREYDNKETSMFNGDKPQAPSNFNDSGNASRFFKSIIYTAKASKSERDADIEGIEKQRSGSMQGCIDDGDFLTGSGNKRQGESRNNHPTVKPLALMEYLIKLITPPKGIVLDPFMGSGSTLIAARKLGYKAIGIELNKEYAEIAVKRLAQGVLL